MTARLHVGNLPNECRKEELQDFFGSFRDSIVDIWVARNPPGFGFVTVNNNAVDEFITTFHGKDFQGRAMRVEKAKSQESRKPPRGGDDRRDDRRRDDRRRDDSRDRKRDRDGSRDRKRNRSGSRDRKRDDSRDRKRDRDGSRDRKHDRHRARSPSA
jgi:RNA recognition motif-containing protein